MSGDDNGVRAQLGRIVDRFARDDPGSAGHFISRFVVLRLLGLVYLMAFLTLVNTVSGRRSASLWWNPSWSARRPFRVNGT